MFGSHHSQHPGLVPLVCHTVAVDCETSKGHVCKLQVQSLQPAASNLDPQEAQDC